MTPTQWWTLGVTFLLLAVAGVWLYRNQDRWRPRHPEPRPRVKDLLDDLFTKAEGLTGPEAFDLWWILTALRGPDMNAAADLKAETTARIRGLVCPEIAKRVDAHVDSLRRPPKRLYGTTVASLHFAQHAYAARGALRRQGYFEE